MITAVVGTCLVIGAPLAHAGGSGGADLGTLQQSDVPDALELDGEPSVESVSQQVVVDGDACTQQVEPIDDLDQIAIARFNAAGTDDALMSEAVASFPTAAAAKAAFKVRASGTKAAIKCKTVDVVQAGSDRPVNTLEYKKVAFPKIGNQTDAVTIGPVDSDMHSTAVTFRSGSTVVFLNLFGFEGEPTLKQLKAIARKAEKRLS
jgi:hypothetical protein